MKNTSILKEGLLLILVIACLSVAFFARDILVSTLFGIGLGVICSPPVKWIKEKTKLGSLLSGLIFFGCIGILFSLGLFLLGKVASEQIASASEKLPEIINQVDQTVGKLSRDYNLSAFVSSSSESRLDPTQVISNSIKYTKSFFQFGMSTAAGLALSLIVAFYMAIDPKFYKRQIKVFFPKDESTEIDEKLSTCSSTLRKWFSAQCLDMLAVGLLTSAGLLIIGSDYWVLFGALAGFLSIIPYFGIAVTLVFCTLLTAVSQSELTLWVLLVFMVCQFVEGNFILPQLLKKKVSLPEAPLLVFMALMGFWFGVLGVLMAPALLAITISLVNESDFFERELLVKK